MWYSAFLKLTWLCVAIIFILVATICISDYIAKDKVAKRAITPTILGVSVVGIVCCVLAYFIYPM